MELTIRELCGGKVPATNRELWDMEDQAYQSTPKKMMNGWVLLDPYSIGVKCYLKGKNIVCAIRGTKDVRDIQADLQILYSGLTKSSRYKEDVRIIEEIQSIFPRSAGFKYYGVGHSLGGAILDELIDNGYLLEGLSYNPAVDLVKFRNDTRNKRIYNEDDILYNTMGRFTKNPEVRKNKRGITTTLINTLIPFGKVGTSIQAHLLRNFEGGFYLILN